MIPVIVLGGFLGAGKTTLLNRMLREATDRVAVLVNDFGAINVDAGLIASQGGGVMALTNGCVCCALGPDLSESLASMAHLRPDRIVIEASGVSDPWRIAQIVRLQPGIMLDLVLVLVDALAFCAQLADPWLTDTLERGIARADLVALGKWDLATADEQDATIAAVTRIRPGVRTLSPGADILQVLTLPGLLPRGCEAVATPTRLIADAPVHGFRTWHWPSPPTLDEAALRAVLGALPPSVLRAKGICRLGPEAVPHLLQLVGARWTLERWGGMDPQWSLILIGTPDLPPNTALDALFATALPT